MATIFPACYRDVPDAPVYFERRSFGITGYLTEDIAKFNRGRIIFAENCARCHSGKQPRLPPDLDYAKCGGPGYLDCWNRYWTWTKTDEFKQQMREIVMRDDFLVDNFLSTELRIPATLLQTNACSPLATNGIRDNIWDNFTSTTYKGSASRWQVHGPPSQSRARPREHDMPGEGRGYTRPASLISFMVDGAVPAQQGPRDFRWRTERRGAYGVFQRLDPADALAGKANTRH